MEDLYNKLSLWKGNKDWEKRDHTGCYSLMFSGAVLSLFGFSKIAKLPLISSVPFSLREALKKLDTDVDIPVSLSGKVEGGLDNVNPLEESLVEIRYTEYSESSKCWRSRETTVSHELTANDFYIVTNNGIRIKIVLPTEFVFRHVSLLSVPKVEERELTGEEKDKYDWAVHFNPSFNHELISSKVYMVKHGLRSGQSVFLQGVLRKEGEELVLKCGKRSNLIISTQSIEEEQINNRKSGTFLLLLGSMLLAGGIYRFLNSFVFSKPVTKPIDWKQSSVFLFPLSKDCILPSRSQSLHINTSSPVCSQTIP